MNDKINRTGLYDVDAYDLISKNLTVISSLNVIGEYFRFGHYTD